MSAAGKGPAKHGMQAEEAAGLHWGKGLAGARAGFASSARCQKCTSHGRPSSNGQVSGGVEDTLTTFGCFSHS